MSEYLFKKNSNLRLFYIHTVVIFMNKKANMFQLCVFFVFVEFLTVYQTISLRFVLFWATFCSVCKNVLSFYYTCVIAVTVDQKNCFLILS